MTQRALMVGAVAYDPKVVTIWDGFQQYFDRRGLRFDYVLYINYERQVEALFAGDIDVAWNSPLAWLQSERIAKSKGRRAEAICMRDTDRDLTSIIIVRSDSGIRSVADLKGRRVAVGAPDSPQATLIPLCFLAKHGLEPHRDFSVLEFDLLRGKHGDHIGGEREAVRALTRGDCEAACLIDGNHLSFVQEGIPSGATRVLAQTPLYDHCNCTRVGRCIRRSRSALRGTADRDVICGSGGSTMLDLEGLKRWIPGRTEGYALLTEAVDRFGYLESFVKSVAR